MHGYSAQRSPVTVCDVSRDSAASYPIVFTGPFIKRRKMMIDCTTAFDGLVLSVQNRPDRS